MPANEPYILLDSFKTTPEPNASAFKTTREPNAYVSARFRLSVCPALAATVNAITVLYPLHAARAQWPPTGPAELTAMNGEKVTVLLRSTGNSFRAPQLLLWEGRLRIDETRRILLPKGSKTHGTELTDADTLDAVPGWGEAPRQLLTTRVEKVRALIPGEPAPLTSELLQATPQVEQGGDGPCTTVLLTTTALPGRDPVHGCLWLIQGYLPRRVETVLHGVLLVPPSHLTSDHGTIAATSLPRSTAVLPAATALPFAQALNFAEPGPHAYLSALDALTPPRT
ncbi:hypothetical protein ABZW18_26200 [Streptomyces sp. NPDC004647]|uniref:hypothetical protein n=1 Tax=Streptomyces sp. NPDC004647 TaxID=3154671 RepID=UPI0033B94289